MASPRSIGFGAEGAEEPESVGAYRLESVLGAGGMGVVHLATSPSGMRLAVKVVHAQHAADPEFRARFRQEVSAARRVSGAFTASVVDADPEADRPWMATVHIPGPTLAERVRDSGPLPPTEVRRLGAGLAEALRDIHRAGVVHRDLKPSNVLLAADGPKVIDFGISRPYDSDLRTETGKLIGTPPFMAPEQFQRPREVGPAADVFAMGAVLVHAATGRGPFDSESHYIVAYQVVHNEPDLAGVPEDLEPVLRDCLAKEPGDRPTPDELMSALRSAAYGSEAHIPTQRFRNPVRGKGAAVRVGGRLAARARRFAGRARWGSARSRSSGSLGGGVAAVRAMPDGTGTGTRGRRPDTGRGSPVPSLADAVGPGRCRRRRGPYGLLLGRRGRRRAVLLRARGRAGPARCRQREGAVVRAGGGRGDALGRRTPRRRRAAACWRGPRGGRCARTTRRPASRCGPWTCRRTRGCVPRARRAATAADGRVTALNSLTGKARWRPRRAPRGPSGVPSPWPGDGPARRGTRASTPSADGASTSVTAVDPATGAVRWQSRGEGRLRPVAATAKCGVPAGDRRRRLDHGRRTPRHRHARRPPHPADVPARPGAGRRSTGTPSTVRRGRDAGRGRLGARRRGVAARHRTWPARRGRSPRGAGCI